MGKAQEVGPDRAARGFTVRYVQQKRNIALVGTAAYHADSPYAEACRDP
jgi:hypothetical protein